MGRAHPGANARRHLAGTRAFASAAAMLACVCATEGSAVLINKLLTDGAAMAAACALGRLAVWMARALRRAARGFVAA